MLFCACCRLAGAITCSNEFGTGQELSINDLAEKIKKIIGYNGTIIWDSNKPDGTPRKIMDSSKFNNLGWSHKYSLDFGIKKTVEWYIKNKV